MIKRILLFSIVAGFGYITLSSNASGGAAGPGADGTVATGTGNACDGCHGASTLVAVTVELDSAGVPVSGYLPGHSYTLKVSGTNGTTSNLPKYGFQVAVVKSAGAGTGSAASTGTMSSTGLPTGVRYTPNSLSGIGIDVYEQSSARTATTGTGSTGTTYVMANLPWTAPTSGTGSIKVYGCINAVNGTGGSGGDKWNAAAPVTIVEYIPTSVGAITGPTVVCVGSTITLSDTSAGGTWSSSNSAAATIDGTGVVTGVSTGTSTISYSTGSGVATLSISVLTTPVVSAILGPDSICITHTITLTDSTTGGTWSALNSNATVTGGYVTGVIAGTDSIFYTVTNVCGTAKASHMVYINPSSPTCFPVGIASVNNNNNDMLFAYPNPSYGSFTVELPDMNTAGTIYVTGLMGNVVAMKNVDGNTKKTTLELNNLPSGSYIIKLIAGDRIYREKVTKW